MDTIPPKHNSPAHRLGIVIFSRSISKATNCHACTAPIKGFHYIWPHNYRSPAHQSHQHVPDWFHSISIFVFMTDDQLTNRIYRYSLFNLHCQRFVIVTCTLKNTNYFYSYTKYWFRVLLFLVKSRLNFFLSNNKFL